MSKNITIIGAGIVGVATASYLQRDGHKVTIVDMRPPGEYCSSGNAGILSPGSCVPLATPGILWKVPGYLSDPLGPLTLDLGYLPKAMPWLVRFMVSSRLSRVETIADGLRALLSQTFECYEPLVNHAAVDDLVRRTGYVVTYESRAAYEGDALSWKLRRDRGVIIEELDDAGIKKLVPELKLTYDVGLSLPEQGYVANPERLTKALAAQFLRDGGLILQREVKDVERSGNRVTGLITDSGHVPVEHLVVCAGSHSNEFTSKLGDSLPLEAERGYHVTYSDPNTTLSMPVFCPEHKYFVTPMEMGLRIAGQSEFAGIHAQPNYARADVLMKQMQRMLPDISPVDATKWMGRRPSMPDSLPVIGPATKMANVHYGFGHGHIGLCGGAPTGRLLADLITGRKPFIDPAPYHAGRF